VLLRTEDVNSEYPVEEDNWIRGAEFADSIGCDVLNTSLGYNEFDDSTMNHTYADLDGSTLRNSIAAGIAAKKGMIPVQSAGNSGAAAWHYISAAADAIDILSVGAVNMDREVAGFSSRGPSADGRVKPDVSAVGAGAIGLGAEGMDIAAISGTSFSSPIMCGLVTCLWQLHRSRTAHEVMDAVRRSASHFNTPNDSIGYGIPDFWRAHLLLGGEDLTYLQAPQFFNVYPLPFTDHLNIELYAGEEASVDLEIVDVSGRSVLVRNLSVEPKAFQQVRVDDHGLATLPNGSYTLRANIGGRAEITQRLVKAP
jgi:serine protease AprX